MTRERLEKILHEDEAREYLKFQLVLDKLSGRADLHAFLLLDRLCPGSADIVSCAEHDEFYLSVEPAELEDAASDAQLVELRRCGLRYDPDNDSLCMFA
jgi:hypothetical protein